MKAALAHFMTTWEHNWLGEIFVTHKTRDLTIIIIILNKYKKYLIEILKYKFITTSKPAPFDHYLHVFRCITSLTKAVSCSTEAINTHGVNCTITVASPLCGNNMPCTTHAHDIEH